MTKLSARSSILIVDDMPSNIKVLGEALKDLYDIRFARSGKEAMALVDDTPPDLILLDIMMPGIDGYEVCRALMAERKSRDIPIVFITARDDAVDEAKGFQLGAVDYIIKPFNPDIVRARVRTHLELKRHRDHLNDLIKERTRQLIHADRLATLGTLSAAVAHEIKNPLFFIGGNAEMALQYYRKGDYDQIPVKLEKILEGTKRIGRLIENLRGYSQNKERQRLTCRVSDIVKDALDLIGHRLKTSRVVIAIDDIPPDLKIVCDVQAISQVFVNLITNALDAVGDREGEVTIRGEKKDGVAVVTVRDTGTGISPDRAESIFAPFVTSKPGDQGTGLGLFIVRHLVEDHDGTIRLTRNDKDGAEFTIRLPGAPDQECLSGAARDS
ncbi:response regulator [Desulfatiferula olefinivorans]